MIKAVFFDFDGTIADTFPIVVRTANQLLIDMGKPPLKDPRRLRGMSAMQIVRESGIPLWKVPFLQRKALGIMANEMQQALPFDGLREVVEDLREHYLVGVITSNVQDSVETVLRKHKIGFDIVSTGSSLFGKDRTIKTTLKTAQLKPEEIVYVGDEVRDIDASRSAGVKVISVTWGFNNKAALKAAQPDAIADTPGQLMKAIRKLDRN